MTQQSRISVTTAPPAAAADRTRRMVQYTVAMSLRFVCLLLMFVVPGWWKLAPLAAAAILPYYAVVIANLPQHGASSLEPVRPKELPKQDQPGERRQPPSDAAR